jgi:hypothetical protein
MPLELQLGLAQLVLHRQIRLDQLFKLRGDELEETFDFGFPEPAETRFEALLPDVEGSNFHPGQYTRRADEGATAEILLLAPKRLQGL